MAKIGSYGDVVFEVSDKKILTPKGFERNGSGRWNEHDILNQKPKSEFVGPGLEDVTFTILLKADLGVNPAKEIIKLRNMRDSGKTAPFIEAGKPISSNHWSLRNLNEIHKFKDNKGNLLVAEVQLSLKEHEIKRKARKAKTVKKPSTGKKAKQKPVSKMKKLGVITITVKSVHIRSGPSTKAKVIGYAMKNDKLTVVSEKNGWYSLGQGKYITANSAYSTLKKG